MWMNFLSKYYDIRIAWTIGACRLLAQDGVDMIGEPGVKAMQRLSASVCRALEVVHHNHSTLDSVHWDPGTGIT